MRRIILILTLMLLITYNSDGQTNITFKKADHYKTKKFDVAIFPENYFEFISEQRFTPSRQEIDKAEIALRNNLKISNKQVANQSSTPIIHIKLNKYKRQYFGYIDKNGDRILFINCFWSKNKNNTERWLTSEIMVLDGGSYYWNVKFNLAKNEIFDLNINGSA
ncbi:hypothetical protein [Flavobacterium cellulosilyticum]|uniref:Uncharacterized protein n=1 Tax=Flavobacterium cellulosilyticum TaxID=2541731 RepID=A0A4R5CIC9_9FLAO|nr:hypothetical protein [Flavobacterium cellulosilyticum]TDD99535.1 hypothetical protein E0F76_02075 [Flavobacterium cellulosilyticum]